MSVEKEEVHEITQEAIAVCRREVDIELRRLHKQDRENAWTEERAEQVAIRAAQLAKDETVRLTKEQLINDAKVEIANGAISILRNAVKIIALFIVGVAYILSGHKPTLPWQ